MSSTQVAARPGAALARPSGRARAKHRQQAHPKRRWWALAVIGLAQLMVVLDVTIANIALPSAQNALHFNNDGRQWIVTAYSLAFGSLLLLGGRLADLLGRKRTFIIGIIGFAGASALGGAAQSFAMLVVARAIQGGFGALLAPAALSLLTTTFTDARERARAFGIYGAIAGSGAAIGLLLGGMLTEYLDWRWTLYVNDVIAVFALIGAIAFVSRSIPASRPRLDVPGVVLVSGGLFSIVFGFANAQTHSWTSWMTWGFLAAGAVILLAFFLWQARSKHPLLPLRVLADRNRGAAMSTVLIASAGMFGVFLFLTYYLQATLGYSPVKNGVAFLPMIGVLMVMAQLSTNWLVPKIGPKLIVPVGLLLAAIGMAWLTRLGLHSSYAAHVLPPLLLLGAGIGLSMPAAMSRATLGVQMTDQGVASATVNTTQQIGGAISTALLNTLAASAATSYAVHHLTDPLVKADATLHSYGTAYWWAAAFFAAGALVTMLLFRRKRASQPTAGAGSAAAAIRGRVLDGAGAPMPRAVIALLDPAGRQLARAVAGEDGSYEMRSPERGSMVIIGSAPRHRPEVATLAVGSAPISLDVVMLAGTGDLTGTVRDQDSDPVAGALVVATDQRGEVAASAITGIDGRYRIGDMEPGGYMVTVSAAGHPPATGLATVAGEDTTCDLQLRRAMNVQGTVRGRDGRPLPDTQVTLLDTAGTVIAVRSTAADGTYSFTGLAGNEYTLIASGYPPAATAVALNGNSHQCFDLFLGHEAA